MCFRITTMSPTEVVTGWPAEKARRYRMFEEQAQKIAGLHNLPLQAVADALFLYHDL